MIGIWKKKKLFLFLFIIISVSIFSRTIILAASSHTVLEPDKTWVVTLEVEKYPGEMTDLKTGFINSKRIRETFIKLGLKPSHIKEFKNNITQDTLKESIKWFQDNSKQNDLIVLYIFAHGRFIRYYLLWTIFFPDQWQQLNDRKQILIVDSCNAGEFIDFARAEKGVAMSSCRDTEMSWCGLEEEGLPIVGSVWTYFFARSIFEPKSDQNGDGYVSLTEAFRFTTPQLQQYMEEEVFAVEKFLNIYQELVAHPEKIGNYPNPVIYNNLSEEIKLYRLK